jgi:cell division protein FtsB
MVALWNRNQLIADQDQVITELRGENRTLQQDITRLRGDLEAVAAERDYWQGKAANP